MLITILQSLLIAAPILYLTYGVILVINAKTSASGGKPPFWIVLKGSVVGIFVLPALVLYSSIGEVGISFERDE